MGVDALLVGGFFLAFVPGAVVQAADALVDVSAAHWLPVAIVVALFNIAHGFVALQRAKKATGLG